MITPSDFIRIPYTPDLTQSGIAYACRSLHSNYDRVGGSVYARLRRVVASVAVELSLRRLLTERGVSFDTKNATTFTAPDKYDITLGGHRCDVKSFLINKREQITAIKRTPAQLLRAPALIPSDLFASEAHTEQDIYIFAFLSGLTTVTREDLLKAIDVQQPYFLIHPLPREWSRPQSWVPLTRLSLKSECDEALMVELGGQTSERDFVTTTLELSPRTLTRVPQTYFSLSYLSVNRIPSARVGLHSPVRGEPYIITPENWGNLWVYGMEMTLAGYITHEEFRNRANPIPEGARVFQFTQTRTKNLAVPIADLRPLGDLFEQVKDWETTRNS